METIEMARGRKTGGRRPGSLNKSTLVGKGVSEIFKHMMGIDDAAVERTGQINREGYGFRRRWQEILDGTRNPDPAYTNVVKLSLAYAVGNPGKLQEASKQRESLVFLTTNGMVPWDPRADSMKDITDRMLIQKSAEEKVLALEAKAEPVAADKADHDSETPESLELVQEPPQDFNLGRGGR
jgi:hypothetical protein